MKKISTKISVGVAALSISLSGLVALGSGTAIAASKKSSAVKTLTIGTLYAGSGAFSSASLLQYAGLQFWAKTVNAKGGMYVGPFKKKAKIKIVAYNDLSDPATAATLYSQLLYQDHVDILVADFGSVLTAPAITLAKNQKRVLFDVSGSGTVFFSNGANPYTVLTSVPVSSIWPLPVASLLVQLKAQRVAILYDQNDFDQAQANTVQAALLKAGVTPVYFQGVPTSQSDYSTLVQSIVATKPDAVLEFGYANNDMAFLNELKSTSTHFKFVLTPFLSQLPSLFETNVGTGANYTYTYGVPPVLSINKVNYGLGMDAFAKAYQPSDPSAVNFPSIAGYNAGLVIQASYQHATSMTQLGIRAGVTAISGKLHTLVGQFKVNNTGAQIGEPFPIAQAIPSATGFDLKMVFPANPSQAVLLKTKPLYPAPVN